MSEKKTEKKDKKSMPVGASEIIFFSGLLLLGIGLGLLFSAPVALVVCGAILVSVGVVSAMLDVVVP